MAGTCERCGAPVVPTKAQQEKFPGWTPALCSDCWRADRDAKQGARPGSGGGRAASRGGARRSGAGGGRNGRSVTGELNLTLEEVLSRFHAGPDTGVFTDGSAVPNPGPGGWGAVYVIDGVVQGQDYGHEPDTTNNRMELTALLHGARLVPDGTPATLHTDSKLCVDTLNTWAAGWQRNGWKRKKGAIANLDLVRPLYELLQDRPELTVVWIKAHNGQLWNEYADALATAWQRDTL